MNPLPLAVLVFVVVAALAIVPYYVLVVRNEEAERRTLRKRLRGAVPRAAGQAGTGGVLKDEERLSAIAPLHRMLAGGTVVAGWLRTMVSQSGARVTVGQLVLGSACLVLLVDLFVTARTGLWWLGAILGLAAGFVPFIVLRVLRARRLSAFEEHFPEAIDLIARTLRAGHAFSTGLRLAADELPDPVRSEFQLLHDQQNYGLPITDGLKDFARRVPIIDARFFVTAVLTQREAGGNLAEVLDNLATVIRERFRIKRQLQVMTARGRLTGWILAALPPALGGFFLIRMPEHFRILIEEPLGLRMILVAVVLQLIGAVMIHKITAVEY
ncbi:MAG: type II secretion system F family protein [Acidobacteria bacterium]|nr:type II secretion system F family protein [Acidobacteriota bacterium]